MKPIVATLPPLEFTPYYIHNREYTDIYSEEVRRLSKILKFDVCEMEGLAKYLVDGVHFNNAGYKKIAEKWADKILSLK